MSSNGDNHSHGHSHDGSSHTHTHDQGPPKQVPGGITPSSKPADQTSTDLANQFKDEAAKKLGVDSFSQWKVVEYKTQVVAGINYFIKVQSGDDEAVLLRIWDQPWTSTRQLSDVKGGKKLSDPIEYF